MQKKTSCDPLGPLGPWGTHAARPLRHKWPITKENPALLFRVDPANGTPFSKKRGSRILDPDFCGSEHVGRSDPPNLIDFVAYA